MTVLLGSSSAGADSANSNLSQTAFGIRLQCLASGTVTTIATKSTVSTTLANCHAALYADNAGQLTGATRLSADITTPVPTGGWHIYTVSPGVAVVLGTFYWLEFLKTDGVYTYTDFATSGGTTRDTTGRTALADPHPSTTSNFTNLFNAYAEGTPAPTSDDAHGGLVPVGVFDPEINSQAWF
jgi:hypothetical protein